MSGSLKARGTRANEHTHTLTSGAGQWELVIQGLNIVGGEEPFLVVQLTKPPSCISILAQHSYDATFVEGEFVCIVSCVRVQCQDTAQPFYIMRKEEEEERERKGGRREKRRDRRGKKGRKERGRREEGERKERGEAERYSKK